MSIAFSYLRSQKYFVLYFSCSDLLQPTLPRLYASSAMNPSTAMPPIKPLLSRPSTLTFAFRGLSLNPERSFATTAPNSTKNTERNASFDPTLNPVHPYPYGPRRIFKQADTGLYGGTTVQFGNKISKGRNEGKTRRTWHPNIRRETLYSEALQKSFKLKVQHRVLRTIKKVGGLDNYLLDDKPSRIKELGLRGWNLRWRIMNSPVMQDRFAKEREELGLAPPETFEQFLERYSTEELGQEAAKQLQQSKEHAKTKLAEA